MNQRIILTYKNEKFDQVMVRTIPEASAFSTDAITNMFHDFVSARVVSHLHLVSSFKKSLRGPGDAQSSHQAQCSLNERLVAFRAPQQIVVSRYLVYSVF